jgi:Cu/Ag efflux pump CusA
MLFLVSWCARYRVLVVALAFSLIIFGVLQLRSMPVDVLPEFAPPKVEVQTEALGLSASEVESLITLNLEELLSSVPWLKTIRSQSLTGLSSIEMIFEPGTDVMRARQMIQERLTLAYTLPNVSKAPVMLQPVSATSRVMMVGISSQKVPLIQLSVIAQWTIKTKLLGVPGVANVAIWGERRRQLQVQMRPDQMRTHGVSQDRVISSSGDSLWVSFLSFLKSSVPGTGGWIDGPQQRLEIRHVLPVSTAGDLARVSVDGKPELRLGDLANVVEEHPLLIGDAVVNGGTGLVLVIEKFPWANSLEVTRSVETALASLKLGLPDIEINSDVFRPATYIESAMGNIAVALGLGALLAAVALALLLQNLRIAFIALVTIPMSLLTALMVLGWRGSTINIMVLLGLLVALVPLLDDVIVTVDRVMQRLRAALPEDKEKSASTIVLDSILSTQRHVGYATLILILLAVPIFFMSGISGGFVAPLAISYLLAISASVAVALTITPVLALILYDEKARGHAPPSYISALRRRYESLLGRVASAPASAVVASGAIGIAALLVWPLFGQALLPTFKERDFLVTWTAPAGTSHPEMQRITFGVTRELRAVPGVRHVTAHIGRAIQGDQVVGINASQIWVSAAPGSNHQTTLESIQEIISGYPGVKGEVQTYLQDRMSEVGTGSPKPIVVRVFGHERSVIREKVEDVRQALARLPNLRNVQVADDIEEPLVQVKVDIAKAGKQGLKPGDVRRAASTVFAGLEVGKIFESQKIYEVVVWSTPNARDSLSSIRDLLLETPGGNSVSLADIAEVKVVPSPAVIKHQAISNYYDVVADVNGSDLGGAQWAVDRALQSIKFPLETHAELLGGYAQHAAAQKRVLAVSIGVIIWALLILQAAFRSWRLATVMLLAMPFAVAGGVLTTFASDRLVSLGALAGLAAVLVLAVRNGSLLVRHFQDLERQGVPRGTELIVKGGSDLFVPVLMTAVTLALLLVPIVAFGAQPGMEIIRPMAIALLGGLVSSTLLTLFAVPVLYLWCGTGPRPDFERQVGHAA